MTLALDEWLGVVGREYVDSFVPAGGGAVRFVVADAATLEQAAERLRGMAGASGLHVVAVDLSATKLHMLQNLFFAISTALPWEAMLRAKLAGFLEEAGYRARAETTGIDAMAAAISVAPHLLPPVQPVADAHRLARRQPRPGFSKRDDSAADSRTDR